MGNLQWRFPCRKETKADCYPIGITGQRKPWLDSSAESETPDNRSKEEAELFRMDPQYPERALRIGEKLPSSKKAHFKKLLSENLDVFEWTPTNYARYQPNCHLPLTQRSSQWSRSKGGWMRSGVKPSAMKSTDYSRMTHLIDILLGLAHQSSPHKEKERQMEGLHRLYQSKWSLSQRKFSSFKDRPAGRGNNRIRST